MIKHTGTFLETINFKEVNAHHYDHQLYQNIHEHSQKYSKEEQAEDNDSERTNLSIIDTFAFDTKKR
jgi:hypothetical protein